MIHVGIDHGKKFSHVVAMMDSGEVCFDGRLASTAEAFREFYEGLPAGEPVQSVLEAGWNWGVLYDAIEDLGMEPKLANPAKTRVIGASFIKTDRIDATALAQLLKAGMVPLVHVPAKEVRDRKNLLRHRFWLVRLQTSIKNRVHSILDRNHVRAPEVSDVFGNRGRAWLNTLDLRDPDGKLLRSHLALFDMVRAQIRETQQWVEEALKENAYVPILQSMPGFGETLAALVALEIDTVERFAAPEKLCAYSGLACSTYSSGGRTYHGGLIPTSNSHLRFAFVEAAWVAVRVSPYFGAFYRRLKARRGANKAIGAVARKLCEIAFHCLKKRRFYEERVYQFKPVRHEFQSGRLERHLAGSRG